MLHMQAACAMGVRGRCSTTHEASWKAQYDYGRRSNFQRLLLVLSDVYRLNRRSNLMDEFPEKAARFGLFFFLSREIPHFHFFLPPEYSFTF